MSCCCKRTRLIWGYSGIWSNDAYLGEIKGGTSRWAFACVSLLFYCCNGLCKLIPERHDNSSEPVSDCPSSPHSPFFIKTQGWEIFHRVTIITMAQLLFWCDGSCCCAPCGEYERSFLTHRGGSLAMPWRHLYSFEMVRQSSFDAEDVNNRVAAEQCLFTL